MSAPAQETASVVQDFTARPSTCTTHAPHWLVSQPTCVPVSRRCSRRNWDSSVRGSMSAEALVPFTLMVTSVIHILPLKSFFRLVYERSGKAIAGDEPRVDQRAACKQQGRCRGTNSSTRPRIICRRFVEALRQFQLLSGLLYFRSSRKLPRKFVCVSGTAKIARRFLAHRSCIRLDRACPRLTGGGAY